METEVKVGDIIYRAYYFGDDIILDTSKVVSIAYETLDLNELNANCGIERDDKSIHYVKVKRIMEEWAASRIKAFTKLFDKHMKILQKILVKMEGE